MSEDSESLVTLKIKESDRDWLDDEQRRIKRAEGKKPTQAALFSRLRWVYQEWLSRDIGTNTHIISGAMTPGTVVKLTSRAKSAENGPSHQDQREPGAEQPPVFNSLGDVEQFIARQKRAIEAREEDRKGDLGAEGQANRRGNKGGGKKVG